MSITGSTFFQARGLLDLHARLLQLASVVNTEDHEEDYTNKASDASIGRDLTHVLWLIQHLPFRVLITVLLHSFQCAFSFGRELGFRVSSFAGQRKVFPTYILTLVALEYVNVLYDNKRITLYTTRVKETGSQSPQRSPLSNCLGCTREDSIASMQ